MKAFFLFNDWQMDLSEYDLVICLHNYDPVGLRRRSDIRPGTKLAAYVCFETLVATPWGEGSSTSRRIYNRLADPRFLMREGTGPGYVPGERLEGREFFSSYPWPKTEENARTNRWDFALTFGRVKAQAEVFAHELSAGWDVIYVDQCRPLPNGLAQRYHDAGIGGFESGSNRLFAQLRQTALLGVFLRYLRLQRGEPILGNTAGWTSPYLDGICIEWSHQQPWRDDGLNMLDVLKRFRKQARHCTRNGRGVWSVDFAGRFNVPGLAMPGVLHRNEPDDRVIVERRHGIEERPGSRR